MKNLKQSLRTSKDHFRDIRNEKRQEYINSKLSTQVSDKTHQELSIDEDIFFNILPWRYNKTTLQKEYILDDL
jgi:hypothetical protein